VREYQQQPALSAPDAAQLSEMRYRGGAASYLEVLTNETNYFNAELGLAQAQSNELVALIRIYKNLDGGWQTKAALVHPDQQLTPASGSEVTISVQ
jgi:multidrug efflux system outer membrane protein